MAPLRLRLRMVLPAGVVALQIPRYQREALTLALDRIASIKFVNTAQDCRQVLQQRAGLALIVTVPAANAVADMEQLSALRQLFPHVTWVGVFVDGVSDLSALARLGALGVQEIVPANRLMAADVLYWALSRGETATVAARLWQLARLDVDDKLATLLRPALRLAHEPISLARLASATRMHERTLRKYCELHRLRSPQWIVGWARCLVAAFYLDEHGRSVQSIASVLAFNTPVLLANHLRRYTGTTATELRKEGALHTVARLLEANLRPKE